MKTAPLGEQQKQYRNSYYPFSRCLYTRSSSSGLAIYAAIDMRASFPALAALFQPEPGLAV